MVKLFRLVKRENKINYKILAFLVSYNYRLVRIYSYYAIIKGANITFYRYPIYIFDFIALDSKEK